MKKWLAAILMAALVLGMSATNVWAAGPGRGRNDVDTDGDGLCGRAHTSCAFVDADGDGVCDSCGKNAGAGGCGGNFIDRDGDGTCDCYDFGTCPRSGAGRGYGCRGGRGR